ncbi:4Fe-4S ferredoxin iron-sulfur binding domain-containing protein [Thermodesulfobium narugense DSM 14796]|uniref:4Fe-4S ferredoxin iron-sulfur binding domain-containing protein n=1 Tax=Thermodesulfobium narugense DSM 14796 TaxID=747365 RepID=M1E986_9BACT|nr:4Fe-4S binding protein [Thermodesulfobium narugense]AEE14949.1 4Fe-4S ferredoxin iron-sulfur binding domain-containing protein [Thermodesulfobium narugense DSM 14796]
MAVTEIPKLTDNIEALVSEINPDKCSGCGVCLPLCSYSAITWIEYKGKKRAHIDPALCTGCGVCVAACPSRAIILEGFTTEEIESQIENLTF